MRPAHDIRPLDYPLIPHRRKHGPRSYKRSERYKPWLRDDFTFRCVYCLNRERWFPNGQDAFSVDHIIPRSKRPDLMLDYENLLYACCGCNSARRDVTIAIDPTHEPLGNHLVIEKDGSIRPLTADGQAFIDMCQLDRPQLVEHRRLMLLVIESLRNGRYEIYGDLFVRYFGFPVRLPDLAALRPPNGNTRPTGIAASHFSRRKAGELPELY
jgi:hypothetical protein